jgi:outer membrane protein, heavy metal efflux system
LPAPIQINEPGMSLSLQAALYGAVTSNPDLVALRQASAPSREAVEVAKHFPTTLNPTLWVDYRPITLVPPNTFGGTPAGTGTPTTHTSHHDSFGKQWYYFSWRQPIELGHQTRYRAAIAEAAYTQQQWTVVQAEMLALVQTYRFFETAAYRREKLRVAGELAEFNDKLVPVLRRRLDTNPTPSLSADVALAEVENQATRQQVEAARQDYVTALTDLRNQIGVPATAGTAEPLGEFVLPAFIPQTDDQGLIELALRSRPEIYAARAAVQGALAAVRLAQGDRKPTPVVGPLYEADEADVKYIGFVYITAIPIMNNGAPLVRQRQAEHQRAAVALQQIEQRTIAQVKAAIAKWNQANDLVQKTKGLTTTLKTHLATIERLFDEGQTDLPKLLQARQRLIQLENNELDAVWQATQAQADLLTALGAPTLIASIRSGEVNSPAATPAPPANAATSLPAPPSPATSPPALLFRGP